MLRNITKELACKEDLNLGVGTVEQVRGGVPVSVTKLDMPAVVNTIQDMLAIDNLKHRLVVVLDLITGGLFSFNIANININNGGTIILGWERLNSQNINAKWFGLLTDEQTYKKASLVSNYVEIPPGTYDITTDDIDLSSVVFYSLGVVTITGQTTITVKNLLE